MRISDWSSDVCSSDLNTTPAARCCMAATSFSPGVRHPAISAPITIAIMGIRENLSAAIVSAPLCQVGWSQARILPAQDRGLVPFLDLEFVAREHRAHRVAAIRSEERRVGKEGVRQVKSRGQ